MNLVAAATFATVFAALSAAHAVGDHWSQEHEDAQRKGLPGWEGRWACLRHVLSYLATAAAALVLTGLYIGLELELVAAAAGLAVSGVSHYVADRREPLRRIADALGKREFYQVNSNGICGSYLLDQSWHLGFTLWAALIAASGNDGLGVTVVLAAAVTIALAVKVRRFERRGRLAKQVAPVSPAVEIRQPASSRVEA
ncbi:hypothetical protein AB0K52_22400 [Glycomyces sp. NPDC049804]|uniref:hypothetical protein n=1 Tax=Glycomyces sp. NPDC049804 TaxID=3154363 RepID=UPI003439D4A0